jgi:hypothetical protein
MEESNPKNKRSQNLSLEKNNKDENTEDEEKEN